MMDQISGRTSRLVQLIFIQPALYFSLDFVLIQSNYFSSGGWIFFLFDD